MIQKHWKSYSTIFTIGILSGLVAVVSIGCTSPNISSVPASSQSKSKDTIAPTVSKNNEKDAIESSEKVSLGNPENSPEPVVVDQIEDGRYWIGHTDQGLEVDGKRYRYDTELGSQPWKNISDLKYVRNGVVFDGKNHWCLSTLAPKNKVSSCTAEGWKVAKVESSENRKSEGTITVDFRFYLRQDLEKMVQQGGNDRLMQQEPRIMKIIGTACGTGAIARVTTMPNFTSQDALVPEKVVEVDTNNNTLHRWGKPLDSKVLAIEGDRILVEADQNQRYWIDTDGNLEIQTEMRSMPSPTTVPYKKHPEFGTSGIYSQRFVDLTSGRDRQIIADAPCT